MDLGTYGLWTGGRALSVEERPAAARLAEDLGFKTLWFGGSPRLTEMRPLLEATERLIVATGIVSIWHYEPAELAAEYAELERDFPGRLLVGLGVAHPENTANYAKPLATMAAFLDGLDGSAGAGVSVPKERRCVAALGPKMLDLSASHSWGTHPYFSPVAHTRFARERLGAGPLLAPELSCVVGDDPGRARARAFASFYLGITNYVTNLKRFGFSDAEIEGAADRLIDEIVPQGSPETIAAVARAHIEAGADHVCVQAVGVSGFPRAEWTALAGALLG
jgi:probable F420-dependent oxidoreductase